MEKNLLKCHGMRFTATIERGVCEGKISVQGQTVFLCQNFKNGLTARNKLGYSYSWSVLKGTEDNLRQNSVYQFKLLDQTEDYEIF